MSMSIHIEDDLYQQAKLVSKGEHRTISEQIAYWAKLGMAASEGEPLIPNAATIQAIQDARAGINAKSFSNLSFLQNS